MRTEIIEKYIYFYDELSDKYKEKAKELLNETYNRNIDFRLFDDMYEKLNEILNDSYPFIKVEREDLRYSLSYSQGDGVNFTTNNIDSRKFIEWYASNSGEYISDFVIDVLSNNLKFSVERCSHFYRHSNTIYANVSYIRNSRNKLVNSLVDNLEDKLIYVKEDICKKLEKYGYSIIEWIWKEENLKEYAKDYEFTEIEGIFNIVYKE